MNSRSIDQFLQEITQWACNQPDILGLALVGSYARGTAGPDSDVDLVLVTDDPAKYLEDQTWVALFGKPRKMQTEEYGLVTSIRVFYVDGLEVEYGITDERWVKTPLDPGTRQVMQDGIRVLYERGDLLSRHLGA